MFSFKTYIRPLRVLETRSAVMRRLLAAFLALPPEVVSPTGLHLTPDHVLVYVRMSLGVLWSCDTMFFKVSYHLVIVSSS